MMMSSFYRHLHLTIRARFREAERRRDQKGDTSEIKQGRKENSDSSCSGLLLPPTVDTISPAKTSARQEVLNAFSMKPLSFGFYSVLLFRQLLRVSGDNVSFIDSLTKRSLSSHCNRKAVN
jgi:hypothetical protein